MRIAVGADHAGYAPKESLAAHRAWRVTTSSTWARIRGPRGLPVPLGCRGWAAVAGGDADLRPCASAAAASASASPPTRFQPAVRPRRCTTYLATCLAGAQRRQGVCIVERSPGPGSGRVVDAPVRGLRGGRQPSRHEDRRPPSTPCLDVAAPAPRTVRDSGARRVNPSARPTATRAVRRHRPGGGAAEHDDPAHRQRELHLAGGAPGHRLRAHQQVRRGLPGQALLRRQPVHRRVGGPRHRAGQGALRRRARQRAAPLRCQREHGRLPGAAGARRHDPRAVTRPRRAPHARPAGQRQRAALPLRVLQAQPERRTHRPRPGAGPRPSRTARG